MRGVPDEQHRAAAEALGDPAVHPEEPGPGDGVDPGTGVEPLVEPLLQLLPADVDAGSGVRRDEVGRHGTEDAVPPAVEREDADESACGEVQADAAGRSGGAGEPHVGEQPGLGVGAAGEAQPGRAPHRAARAVGADQPPGRDLALRAARPDAHPGAVGGGGHGDELGRALDPHPELAEALGQQPLGAILPQPQGERERGAVDPQRHHAQPPAALEHLGPGDLHTLCDGPLGHPEPVPQLQGPDVHDRRTRLGGGGGGAVDDSHVQPALGEHDRQAQPRRAGPDHQDTRPIHPAPPLVNDHVPYGAQPRTDP
ncbi:hypothetical protein KDL28_33415 [Pseudonocardia sp. S2-4]|uniref:Uncharacterized protein n=1 Tax=Pseudonocardia humida TaxID=2800819 RepID=A0ABT1AAX9_9PSEU|nr:hypothetical protein [Pseudonocardia humida]MCO1659969.1 hypothetical protein [Pseudonocardia humida]